MQPFDRFPRSIGYTGPLRSAKSHAPVAAFCQSIGAEQTAPSDQIRFLII